MHAGADRRHPGRQEGTARVPGRGARERAELATGDVALGFWKALEAIFPATRHQRCWVHTIRTQLRIGLDRAVAARLRGAQWDDMADLQTAVADDDALDDELQDRLLVGEGC